MLVSEFRKDLKKHFDTALKEPVYIERGGVTFTLVSNLVPSTPPPKNTEAENPWVEDLINSPEHFSSVREKKLEPTARDKGTVLNEINTLEAQRDEELRWCQDIDTRQALTKVYGEQIAELWAEYKSLKGE